MLRPTFSGYDLHPNVAGGILAALIPLQLAALFSVKRSGVRIWLGALCLGLSALGLFMSAARGAWLALAIVLIAWGLWWVSGQVGHRRKGGFRIRDCAMPSWAVVVINRGRDDLRRGRRDAVSESRLANWTGGLTLWRNSLDLALDYPLSGLGLASFEMPYSSYVLLVHVGYLTHAHNLLLDVWLGQGLLGLLGLGWLLAVAVRTRRQASPWRHAAFASLAVILLHGLLDDAFYGYDGRGVVLLFVPFALLARPVTVPGVLTRSRQPQRGRRRMSSSSCAASRLSWLGCHCCSPGVERSFRPIWAHWPRLGRSCPRISGRPGRSRMRCGAPRRWIWRLRSHTSRRRWHWTPQRRSQSSARPDRTLKGPI